MCYLLHMHPDYIRALQKKRTWEALVQHLRDVYLPQPGSTGPGELTSDDLPASNNPVPQDVLLEVLSTLETHAYAEEQEAHAFQMVRTAKGQNP